MIVFMFSCFFVDTLDFILDSVADTGLHFHALARFLLRLLLLLLLAGVLRVGLTFLQRLSQILCSLVGLAIVVHRHLRAALVGRSNLLCIVRVRVVAVRAALLRVELDIHRGMEALLVGHVLQLHGFTRHIVGFLLVGEAHAAPFADGADAAVLVRPRVAALLLLGLCGIFPALRLTFRRVAFGFLRLCGTGRPSGSRHELHAALLHVHLQGGDELPAVVALDELVAHGQSGAEHVLLLFGDFRLADALRVAQQVRHCRSRLYAGDNRQYGGGFAHGRGGLRAVENKPAHVADAARQAAYRLLADKPQVLLQAGGGEAADTACRHALSARQMI